MQSRRHRIGQALRRLAAADLLPFFGPVSSVFSLKSNIGSGLVFGGQGKVISTPRVLWQNLSSPGLPQAWSHSVDGDGTERDSQNDKAPDEGPIKLGLLHASVVYRGEPPKEEVSGNKKDDVA